MVSITSMNLTDGARAMAVRHQQLAWAIKLELGFQICGLPNDCLTMSAGGVADPVKAMELAAIALKLKADILYLGFRAASAKEPCQIALAYRDDLCVDWRDELQLYAADPDAPLILVDTARGEHYARGGRNQLIRVQGMPVDLARGRKRAMARVRRTAAIMPQELSGGSFFVPPGEDVLDHQPQPSGETVVRLS
jgi:hypothetical protein